MRWYSLIPLLLSPVVVWCQTTACSVTYGYNGNPNHSLLAGYIEGESVSSAPSNFPLFMDTVYAYYGNSSTNAWAAVYDGSTLIASSAQIAVVNGWNKFTLSALVGLYKGNAGNYTVAVQFQDGYYQDINTSAQTYKAMYASNSYSSTPPSSASWNVLQDNTYQVGLFGDYCGTYPKPTLSQTACSVTWGTNSAATTQTDFGQTTTYYGGFFTTGTTNLVVNEAWIFNPGAATNAIVNLMVHIVPGCYNGTPVNTVQVATTASTAVSATSWNEIPFTAPYTMLANQDYITNYYLQSGNYLLTANAGTTYVALSNQTYTGSLPTTYICTNVSEENSQGPPLFLDYCGPAPGGGTFGIVNLLGGWWK